MRYDRWYLAPAVTKPAPNTDGQMTTPKYADTAGIVGFAGTTTAPSVVETSYPALVQTHPDVDEWYIVRMYGDGDAGWSALNDIHNKGDTRTLADHANDVAPVLNSHFPDLERPGAEWAAAFKIE